MRLCTVPAKRTNTTPLSASFRYTLEMPRYRTPFSSRSIVRKTTNVVCLSLGDYALRKLRSLSSIVWVCDWDLPWPPRVGGGVPKLWAGRFSFPLLVCSASYWARVSLGEARRCATGGGIMPGCHRYGLRRCIERGFKTGYSIRPLQSQEFGGRDNVSLQGPDRHTLCVMRCGPVQRPIPLELWYVCPPQPRVGDGAIP